MTWRRASERDPCWRSSSCLPSARGSISRRRTRSRATHGMAWKSFSADAARARAAGARRPQYINRKIAGAPMGQTTDASIQPSPPGRMRDRRLRSRQDIELLGPPATGYVPLPPATAICHRLQPCVAVSRRRAGAGNNKYLFAGTFRGGSDGTRTRDLREPATSGVTGRYGTICYDRLRPGVTGCSRHFMIERIGCDRLRPATTGHSLCGICVVELVPASTTLAQR